MCKTTEMKGITSFRIILYTAFFLMMAGTLDAQETKIDSLLRRGDFLRMEYRFEESLGAYREALEIAEDSAYMQTDSLKRLEVSDRLLLSENGRSMAAYADKPVVVAKHKFSTEDFFLYYPLPDKSWRATPNQLDTMKSKGFSKALYAPDPSWEIYYSAEDADGIRNIYMTELEDTIWTYPALLNENLTSAANEIYPMLSPDGKSLYFASEGLYGMGGYDLYVSRWDNETQDWGAPVNMGFPYSSPADDMLLVNTADGEYTIFASNRDCSADSVWVYVLEFDSMPVRHAVEDPAELRKLASLDPVGANERMDGTATVKADIPENVDIRRYMDKMTEVRSLRDSISRYGAQLDSDRNRYAMSEDDQERTRITQEILRREAMLPKLQDSLDRATSQLQKIEMEFLFSGVVIDPDKVMAAADQEIVGEATSYTFTKMSMGGKLDMKIMDPPVVFDYTFKILPEGQFALDNTIPAGLIYQIQIFGGGGKASVKALKGLSPVFERVSPNGRYVYRVGLFNSYKDVLANLNSVKRVGFRNAFIVAYLDGEEISVSKARTLEAEKTKAPMFYEVRVAPADGEIDSTIMDGIVQQSGGKDVAKVETEEGVVYFIIGPFADKTKAQELAEFIKAMGIGDVTFDLAGMEKEQDI